MNHTRIKICGITRQEDGLLAAQLGANAIGLVFYHKSPRCITLETAKTIVKTLPAFITVVGLFVDPTPDEVAQVLAEIDLNNLQFHGHERNEFCASFGKPYIKSLHVQSGVDITPQIQAYPAACAILLDTYHAQQPGGTGVVFDWNLIPKEIEKPLILAGGLNAANVAQAIHQVRPYAVDISSGVELSPGIKDPKKLMTFFNEVRNADQFNRRNQL